MDEKIICINGDLIDVSKIYEISDIKIKKEMDNYPDQWFASFYVKFLNNSKKEFDHNLHCSYIDLSQHGGGEEYIQFIENGEWQLEHNKSRMYKSKDEINSFMGTTEGYIVGMKKINKLRDYIISFWDGIPENIPTIIIEDELEKY
jgi:hypothetical protein